MCEKKIHTPFSSGGPVGSSQPSRPPGREIINLSTALPLRASCFGCPMAHGDAAPPEGRLAHHGLPIHPGPSARALPCPCISTDVGSSLSLSGQRPPMTLTLQRRPCSRSREKRGLRFLGTVPETDVLVVTHKRNMRSSTDLRTSPEKCVLLVHNTHPSAPAAL